jgi:hypothetical protein
VSLHHCERPNLTPIQNKQHYNSVYINLYIRQVSHFLQATKALRESRGIALLRF